MGPCGWARCILVVESTYERRCRYFRVYLVSRYFLFIGSIVIVIVAVAEKKKKEEKEREEIRLFHFLGAVGFPSLSNGYSVPVLRSASRIVKDGVRMERHGKGGYGEVLMHGDAIKLGDDAWHDDHSGLFSQGRVTMPCLVDVFGQGESRPLPRPYFLPSWERAREIWRERETDRHRERVKGWM